NKAIAQEAPLWLGISMAVLLAATNIAQAVTGQHYLHHAVRSQQMIVNRLNRAIVESALRYGRVEQKTRFDVGQLINRMGPDSDAVSVLLRMLGELFYASTVILLVTVMLFQYIGVSAFVALGLLALS